MSKVYDFLKDCGAFFLLTVNENAPVGRPFGAVMEYENRLYFTTATMKEVYKQLKANDNVQIVALKHGTREWIRISGKAKECFDFDIKEKMLECCPVLAKRYDSPKCEFFALFSVEEIKVVLNTNDGIIELC